MKAKLIRVENGFGILSVLELTKIKIVVSFTRWMQSSS